MGWWELRMRSKPARPVSSSAEARGRPFNAEIVRQADALAARYEIKVVAGGQGFLGTVTSLPTVFGCGASREAALGNAREHLKWALAYLIESGRTPVPDN